jgi:hypothetical protein
MSKNGNYKWLIIVEGNSDYKTYSHLFEEFDVNQNDVSLFAAGNKGFVCKASKWEDIRKGELFNKVDTDIGRRNFKGIILLTDTDTDIAEPFGLYDRNPNLKYIDADKPVAKEVKGSFWELDFINGANKIPVIGINVPFDAVGCLESDLLNSYGFPVRGQCEHIAFEDIIQKSSNKWQIPLLKGGGNWWDENKEAKIDKFIYLALYEGFSVCCDKKPAFLYEPAVIKHIKNAVDSY